MAKKYLIDYKSKMKESFDKDNPINEFETGDYVKVRKHQTENKIESLYEGPYRIISRAGKNNYVVDMGIK